MNLSQISLLYEHQAKSSAKKRRRFAAYRVQNLEFRVTRHA